MSFGGIDASANKTPENYMDFLRPPQMAEASRVFKRFLGNGSSTFDAVLLASDVSSSILTSKGSELDQIWTKIENTINRRKPIKLNSASTPVDELNVALGMMYEAFKAVDKGDNIRELRSLRSIYSEVKGHVFNRFIDKQTVKDRRAIQRVLTTIDSFADRSTARFNERVKAGEIAGPEIEGTLSAV